MSFSHLPHSFNPHHTMSKKKSSREDRDESLDIQNNVNQAGIGEGLGDRSSSGLNSPGRAGAGSGVNADDLRKPASGATDRSLDENEDSYGTGDPQPTSGGTGRGQNKGSVDSKDKDDFIDIDA